MLLQSIIGLRFAPFLAVALACLPLAAASAGPRYPATNGAASPGAAVVAATDDETLESLCLMIESAAKANDLPLNFFARVIWQEGHFEINTVGPQREQMITGAWPVLDPFRPRPGIAEGSRVPERAARAVRQPRACGRGLSSRPGAAAGMACRHGRDTAGDARLCYRYHWRVGRRLGKSGQGRRAARRRGTSQLP
jgi:hypothetical protein